MEERTERVKKFVFITKEKRASEWARARARERERCVWKQTLLCILSPHRAVVEEREEEEERNHEKEENYLHEQILV